MPPTHGEAQETKTRAGTYGAAAAAVLAYVAGAMVWMLPVLRSPSTLLRGGADAYNYAWRIWWFAGGFRQWGGDPFFAPEVFYPLGHHLADAELTPLQMVPAALVSRLTGPIAAYDLMIALAIVAGGLAAFALARVMRVGRLGSVLAGIVFAFSPYVAAHSQGHLPLMGFWTLPAMLAALELAARAWERGRMRASLAWGAACGAALGLAAWSSWYYLVIFASAALAFAIVRAWRPVRIHAVPLRLLLPAAAVALVVAALLVAPVLGVVRAKRSGVEMTWSITKIKGAPPQAYVIPATTSVWFGQAVSPLFTRNPTEDALFVGWIPLALAVVAWRVGKRREGGGTAADAAFGRRALAITAVVCLVISFGPFLYLGHRIPPTLPVKPPAWLVARYPAAAEAGGIPIPMPALPLAFLPGFDGMREFTRYGLVVVLAMGVAAGAGLDALRRHVTARRSLSALLAVGVLLAVFLEFLPRTTVSDAAPRPVDEWLRSRTETGSVVWLPKTADVADQEMYRTILTDKPIAFGDATFLPDSYRAEMAQLETFPSSEAMRVLAERDVRWVVWRTSVAGAPPANATYEPVAHLGDVDVLQRR